MNQIIQSVVSTNVLLATFSNCFTNILLTSDFQTVALVYTNKSTDQASDLYKEISYQTNFAWKVYNLDTIGKMGPHKRFIHEKMFQIFVLDSFAEIRGVYYFLKRTGFTLYDEKAIVLMNQKPSTHLINDFIRFSCLEMEFFNLAFIFWKNPIEFYMCSGLDYKIILTTVQNSTCSNDISELLYYDKMIDMQGMSIKVAAIPHLPGIVRTVGRNENNEIIRDIGGLDIMIADVIDKLLNVTLKYYVLMSPERPVGSKLAAAKHLEVSGYSDDIDISKLS